MARKANVTPRDMPYILDVEVSFSPAPPGESWERFARLPAPAYLWYRRGEDSSGAITGVDVLPSTEVSDGWEVLNGDLNRGRDGMTVYLAIIRGGGSPIHEIKVVSADQAVGAGFKRISRSLSSRDELCLCYEDANTVESGSDFDDIKVGDLADVRDKVGKWCVAKVIKIDQEQQRVYVHFDGWGDKWNEWVSVCSDKLAKYRTYTSGYTGSKTGAQLRLCKENQDVFFQSFSRVEKLIQVKQKQGNLSDMDVKFLNEEFPGFVETLLRTTIDDVENIKKVHEYFNLALRLLVIALESGEEIPCLWFHTAMRVFGADDSAKRFYLKYGVSSDEEVVGEYARNVSTIVPYGPSHVSSYLVKSVNYFGCIGGFDAIIKVFDKCTCSFESAVYLLAFVLSGIDIYVEGFITNYAGRLVNSFFERVHQMKNSDVKNADRDTFTAAIANLDRLLTATSTIDFPDDKRAEIKEKITLEIYYKLLASPFLGKKVFGLNQVCELIEAMNRGRFSRQHFRFLSPQFLVKWIQEKDLLQILLGQDIHQEILKRTPDILKFLASSNSLSPKNMVTLWESSVAQHESIVRSVYNTIANLSQELSLELLDVLYELIQTLKSEQYADFTIEFILEFSKHAICSHSASLEDKLLPSRSCYGLDIFWQLMQDTYPISEDLSWLAAEALVTLLGMPECESLRLPYLTMAISNLKEGVSSAPSMDLVISIIRTYSMVGEVDSSDDDGPTGSVAASRVSNLCEQLEFQYSLLDLVHKDSQRYMSLALDARPSSSLNSDLLVVTGKRSHKSNLVSRLSFVQYLVSNSTLEITPEYFHKLWDVFMTQAVFASDRTLFNVWLTRIRESNCNGLSSQLAHYIFKEYLCNSQRFDLSSLTQDGYLCFQSFFVDVNCSMGSIAKVGETQRIVSFSVKFIGIESLWEIIQKSSENIFKSAMDFLLSLYLDVDTSLDRLPVWQDFVSHCLMLLRGSCFTRDTNLHVFLEFLSRLEKMAHLPSSCIPRSSRTRNGSIRLNLMLVDEPNYSTVVESLTINVDGSRQFGMLRRELARRSKLSDPLLVRLVHASSGVVFWKGETDDKRMRDMCFDHEDTILVVILKSPDMEFPLTSFTTDLATLHDSLCNDSANFELLFDLLDMGGDTARKVWALLQRLPYNDSVSSRLYDLNVDHIDWAEVIDTSSILRMMYSLQIINSEILQVEEGTGSTSKEVWRRRFVISGGLYHLYNALCTIPATLFFDGELPTQCLSLLLKTINEFIFSNSSIDFVDWGCLVTVALDLAWMCSITPPRANEVDNNRISHPDDSDDELPSYQNTSILETYNPVEDIWELLSQSVTRSGNTESVLDYQHLNACIGNGLLSPSLYIRDKVMMGILDLCHHDSIATGVVKILLDILPSIESSSTTCTELMTLLEMLLKTVPLSEIQNRIAGDFKSLLKRIIEHPIVEKGSTSRDRMLEGCLLVARAILRSDHSLIVETTEIVSHLLSVCLFDYVSPDSRHAPPPKCKSSFSRSSAYGLLEECLQSNESAMKMAADYLGAKNHACSHSANMRPDDFSFRANTDEKCDYGYVGIINPGCICYMNSLLQQILMIPSLRQKLLAIDLDISETEESESFMYQLQYILAFLQESERAYVDLRKFCHAFKDFDGTPTDLGVQKDTNEFLNMLFDRIDTTLENTPNSDIIKSEVGGTFANQLFGLNQCNHKRERQEDFYCLSLPVKNKKTLIESLDAFVEGETLAGDNAYSCEECGTKVDTLKRVVLKDLPRNMIIHLKRFELDFNTFQMVKLNDYLEFPHTINLKPYTREGIQTSGHGDETGDTELESREDRPEWYYEYKLSGILIHWGSANAGHYYSYIKEVDGEKWFEFNDQSVTPFDVSSIPECAFGGENLNARDRHMRERQANAYKLFYNRVEPDSCVVPKHVPVPERIFNRIWEDNQTFWRDRYVYDSAYFSFVRSLVLESKLDYSLEESTQLSIFTLGALFYLETYSRSGSTSTMSQWVDWLKLRLHDNRYASQWFIELFANRPRLIEDLLLRCEEPVIQRSVSSMLCIAITCVFEDTSENSFFRADLTAELSQVASLPARFLGAFLSFMDTVPTYWNRFNNFFRVLLFCADSNHTALEFLLRHGLVSLMVHGFLGSQSPYPLYFETPVDPRGNEYRFGGNFATPDTTCFLELLRVLVMDKQFDSASLESDRGMIYSDAFIRNAVGCGHTRRRGDSIGRLVSHIIVQEPSTWDKILMYISEGIEMEEMEGIRPYFRTVTHILFINDELQSARVAIFMSTLNSIAQVNKKYWSATTCCIEHIIRLARINSLVRDWLLDNSQRWSWMIEWLNINGSYSYSPDLTMTKSGRQNQYQSSLTPYGLNTSEKLKYLLGLTRRVVLFNNDSAYPDSGEGKKVYL